MMTKKLDQGDIDSIITELLDKMSLQDRLIWYIGYDSDELSSSWSNLG